MLGAFVLGIVFSLAVAAGGFILTISSGWIPANADAKPTSFERYVAKTSLRATFNKKWPKGPNPVTLSDANLVAGVQLYGSYCTVCHGNANGKAERPPIARANIRPAAVGEQWRRGRSGRLDILENQTRDSLDRNAGVEGRARRQANLDVGAFPEAHGHASPCC